MPDCLSRRDWMKSAFLASALGMMGKASQAADLTPLDPNDPTAKALGFVTDASKVDSTAHPTFKAGQRCGNCAQYQGKPADATGGCTIFAGRSVPAEAWCQVWVKKT